VNNAADSGNGGPKPNGEPQQAAAVHHDTHTPQQPHVSHHDIDHPGNFAEKWLIRPIGGAVSWLDGHNGLVTALATVAVAVLTYFVAVYASGQLRIFGAQLNEMQSTGRQTDSLIEANQKLAEAAVRQAEAAVASVDVYKKLRCGRR
jgi:hypothetical protein